MAGFTAIRSEGGVFRFRVGNRNLAERIRRANGERQVITMQLDGEELDAALWGLEHFRKPTKNHPTNRRRR